MLIWLLPFELLTELFPATARGTRKGEDDAEEEVEAGVEEEEVDEGNAGNLWRDDEESAGCCC